MKRFSKCFFFAAAGCLFAASFLSFSADAEEKRFPHVPEAWEKGVLAAKDTSFPELPNVLPEKELPGYFSLYGALKDPLLRSRMAFELRMSCSKETFRGLVLLLEKEKDPFCQSALLSSLLALAQNGFGDGSFAEKALTYFDLPNWESRKSATALYFLLSPSPAPEKALEKRKGKYDELFLRSFFPFFAQNAGKIPEKLVEEWRKEKDLSRKALGFSFALLRRKASKPDGELLKAALPESPVLVRYYLARSAAYNPDLPQAFFEALFKDNDAGIILAYLREAAGPETGKKVKEELLRKFLAPSMPFSLRLAAAEALKNGKEEESAKACAKLLQKRDTVLLGVASAALAEMRPAESVRELIVQYAEKNPAARLEAVRFFAAVRDEKFDDAVIRFLEDAGEGKTDHPDREKILQELGITLLGNSRAAKGIPVIVKKSSSKVVSVRKCAAESLGKLPSKESFAALKKLLLDKEPSVASAAACSVVQLVKERALPAEEARRLFGKELVKLTGNLKLEFADARSGAVRAVDLLGLVKECKKNLERLAEKECIIAPMAPPSFDADHVRASVLLALYEAGKKGDKESEKSFRRLLPLLAAEAGKEESPASDAWKECLRQLKLLQGGQKIVPAKAVSSPPSMSVHPL
ncbi:MAG: hypothetical protein J6A21_05125 [Lentisphaeria bacterium]|nr:hypothetical protein [Lentisphaeria bacterium]